MYQYVVRKLVPRAMLPRETNAKNYNDPRKQPKYLFKKNIDHALSCFCLKKIPSKLTCIMNIFLVRHCFEVYLKNLMLVVIKRFCILYKK